jgi:hypothetical protein
MTVFGCQSGHSGSLKGAEPDPVASISSIGVSLVSTPEFGIRMLEAPSIAVWCDGMSNRQWRHEFEENLERVD